MHVTDGLRKICATGCAVVLVICDVSAVFNTIDYGTLIDWLKTTFIALISLSLGLAHIYLNENSFSK